MKTLFVIDSKDYNPEGKTVVRNSARGIICREGKVLLLHSRSKGYYKFPGGGIEEGEKPEEALIREMQEETGYSVKTETIQEYGKVLRRQKDSYDENGIFAQDNLYYFCEIEEERVPVKYEDYELEEDFETVWMDPFVASKHNSYEVDYDKTDKIMVKREAKVLDMLDLELRKRERIRREESFIASLGNKDYADMLSFVKSVLAETNSEQGAAKSDIKYSRFDHTKRVLGWTVRLYNMSQNKEALRYDDLIIATIFHDVGRVEAIKTNIPHAVAGVPITREYLLSHGYSQEKTEFICNLVGRHSDKDTMSIDTEPNLLLLMEADLLDDMGALGVIMDCMIVERRNEEAVFADCLDHIKRYTQRIQRHNPMITPEGRKIWDDKTALADWFVASLERDIEASL